MATEHVGEEEISVAAYHIWNAEGRPEGKDQEHWFRAVEQLTSASTPEQAAPKPRRKAPARRAKTPAAKTAP